jgi:predicted NUDIX family NTP pyrophosphohydrolase
MAAQTSAGLLLYRGAGTDTEVFLVHPGGPFWAKKDEGAWSIPKGLPDKGEDLLAAAKREFNEETGFAAPDAEYRALGAVKQPGGKTVHAWAVKGDCDPAKLVSDFFEMEWPPRSGKRARFPEIDRARWFRPPNALVKILPGQRPIVMKLLENLGIPLV